MKENTSHSEIIDSFWSYCLDSFRKEIPQTQFDTWVKPLVLKCIADPSSQKQENTEGAGILNQQDKLPSLTIEIITPNRSVYQWVRERCLEKIIRIAEEKIDRPFDIKLKINNEPAISEEIKDNHVKENEIEAEVKKTHKRSYRSLNPSYTFDDLVMGKGNQLAVAAAQQVVEHPGSSYNPLFIHGGVGLGKTHLVQAIGLKVRELYHTKILYNHAEEYVTQVVSAYQKKTFDDFKNYYRSLDVFIIDDIQFLSSKNRTQEEFFYIFNFLVDEGRQIIITCDSPPQEIKDMEHRLISRFSSGLTVKINPPEVEMRVAILLRKAINMHLTLSEEIAFFIANKLYSNVRELEGALHKLAAYTKFHRVPISIDSVKDALTDLFTTKQKTLTLDNIQKTVASFYRISVAEMNSDNRTSIIVKPRQIAMYLSKELTNLSLKDIGQSFGHRNHTSVLHAVRKINKDMIEDALLKEQVSHLIQIIKN